MIDEFIHLLIEMLCKTQEKANNILIFSKAWQDRLKFSPNSPSVVHCKIAIYYSNNI